MNKRMELLAYCGLYCGDCAGHSGRLADAASELANAIDAHEFDRTAECLFADEIPDYGAFRETLGFLTELRCEAPCRARDPSSTTCAVKACCIERGYFACHECDGFETCDTLRDNVERCGYASLENIRSIREAGLDAWLASGKRRWFQPNRDLR